MIQLLTECMYGQMVHILITVSSLWENLTVDKEESLASISAEGNYTWNDYSCNRDMWKSVKISFVCQKRKC